MATRVLILGAAGRDFHNFNTRFRGNAAYEVVGFTATQIPDIEGRKYPPELAGAGYPEGIPILEEARMEDLIREHHVDMVVFSYSDVTHHHVMHLAARANLAGADFCLLSAPSTMLKSTKPVVAICAVRTGCGKSQTTRRVAEVLRGMGKKVAAVRHPMPYGDLSRQVCQRFAEIADLERHECTIEEMEEYEPHINRGCVVFAGVDYEKILREAEKEADVILWDGGNNDTSFYEPNLLITVADPHRAGHERRYYPGETNFRMADVIVINKIDTAYPEDVDIVRANARELNPRAIIVDAASPIVAEGAEAITGKRVLVVEDGPTLTHGEMTIGAGTVLAQRWGASELVDPRPYLKGRLQETFDKYPGIGRLLPAMGYGDEQRADLEATINATDCDLVVIGTPIDLRRICKIEHPTVRLMYDLQEISKPDLADILKKKVK